MRESRGAASATPTECKPTTNLSHRRCHAPDGKLPALPAGVRKNRAEVDEGGRGEVFASRVHRPERCPPGTAAPTQGCARVPNTRRPTNTTLPSTGIREAGAIPAVRQAPSPAQRQQAPRSLQSPRPGRVRGLRRAQGRPGVGCRAAGPGPHVPRRRCVKRRSTRCKLQESRGEFPRPAHGGRELRQLQRRGATTPSGPNRDFHVLQGAPGITQGKWPGTRAADFPHSLTWKRKAPLGFPETLDYPHRADPAHSLALTHTRAGTGRMPQQSARGGKGAPPPPAPPRAAGRRETPPPAALLLSPPPFLPDRWMSP